MKNSYPPALLAAVLAVLVWSAISPFDRLTWWLEVAPTLVGLVVIAANWRRFRITDLVLTFIALHMILLCVGGHYTYALVPFGDWVKDALHLSRNHYDRLGHVAQGFVPALIARELLIRLRVVASPGWRRFFIVCIAMAISSAYEILEWLTALVAGEASDSFLGTQGDVWDTQIDMALALAGAVAALMFFARWHDRQLGRLRVES